MTYYQQRFPKHFLFSVIISGGLFAALRESWIVYKIGAVPFCVLVLIITVSSIVYCSSYLTDLYLRKKHVRGTTMVSNSEFSEQVGGDGLAIPNNGPDKEKDPQFLQIDKNDESKHILVCGDTGSGKSAIFHYFAKQIRLRHDEIAVFYDPKMEYYAHHGRPEDGDIVLYPFSEDCAYWDLGAEITRPESAKLIAESLLPCPPGDEEKFFVSTPREILEFLLLEMNATEAHVGDLLGWLHNGDEIDRIIEGQPVAQSVPKDAPDQRAGVLGSLSKVGSQLKYLPQYPEGKTRFSLAEYVRTRPGNLYIGGTGVSDQQILQPLFSIWFNILIQQLLDVAPHIKPKGTWILIDELASLKTLGFLEQAMSQARSYNTRLALGFQNKYQIENFYNKLASPIMSAPKTKVFLRTSEIDSAEWAAKMIGEPEFEQRMMSESMQLVGTRSESVSYRQDKKTEYLVLPSEFMKLADREGYLQYQGVTTQIQFSYPNLTKANEVKRREKQDPNKYKFGRQLRLIS